jgi:hypothetical protein
VAQLFSLGHLVTVQFLRERFHLEAFTASGCCDFAASRHGAFFGDVEMAASGSAVHVFRVARLPAVVIVLTDSSVSYE